MVGLICPRNQGRYNQPLRFGLDLLVAVHRIRRGKRGNEVGVPALQIPEVVQIPIGEHYETAVLRTRVLPGLLLSGERIFRLRLGFQDDEGETLGVEKQEVDITLGCLLEVVSPCIQVGFSDLDTQFENDIGRLIPCIEETPAGNLK